MFCVHGVLIIEQGHATPRKETFYNFVYLLKDSDLILELLVRRKHIVAPISYHQSLWVESASGDECQIESNNRLSLGHT